jgi:small neutral amino acid transporter SnatA (MarC family)
MKSVIIGLIIIAAAVFAILPAETLGFGLGWGDDVLAFLRGGLPVIAIVIGIIVVFIGIADIKDRAEVKKEEAEKKEETATR